MLQHIIKVTAKHLSYDTSEIAEDASFFDLGADSLQMIGVLRELEEEHRVKVSMRELFEEAGTAKGLALIMVGKMAPGAAAEPKPAPEPPAARLEPAPEPPVVREAAEPAPAYREPAPAAVPAPAPAPAPAASAEYATRQEIEDLRRQVHQLTQMQLQLMGQLSQLLAAQVGR
ncbi:Acyltransferase domain-containing protein OS=Streptomyces alboniger OX=132473 GN=CP975_10205 PE=4 SV=1 [Streptomyces alboniger]